MPDGDGAVSKSACWMNWANDSVTDGMFAFVTPVALLPLIITLLWAERKARKLGIINSASSMTRTQPSLFRRTLHTAEQLDIIGLVLLGAAVALILLPLTLSQTVHNRWRNGQSLIFAPKLL